MRNFISLVEKANRPFVIPSTWYHSTEIDPIVAANDIENNNIDPTGAVKGPHGNQYWFSDSWDASRYYGENTIVARLNFENPLLVTAEEFASDHFGPTAWAKRARDTGHDAVIIDDIMDGDMFSTVCCVFDSKLIDARPYSRWNEATQDFDML